MLLGFEFLQIRAVAGAKGREAVVGAFLLFLFFILLGHLAVNGQVAREPESVPRGAEDQAGRLDVDRDGVEERPGQR